MNLRPDLGRFFMGKGAVDIPVIVCYVIGKFKRGNIMSGHNHNHVEVENAKRTLLVIILTVLTMVAEIAYGFVTHSMALLSDGWHMGTHALALGITYITYMFIKKMRNRKNSGEISEKISALGGYTSSLFLLVTAGWIIVESVARFLNPVEIYFNDAIVVAVVGLFVNLICVFVMEFKNESNDTDYNFKAAYLHILTDVLTSVFAIVALLAGKYLGWTALDPVIGVLGGIMIFRWSVQLIKNTIYTLVNLR